MSEGRVLGEQMISQLEQSVENEMVQDLIATIYDRDRHLMELNERNIRVIKQRDQFEKQNAIMREALERIKNANNPNSAFGTWCQIKASDALAKIGG